jgi:hypothetical protein
VPRRDTASRLNSLAGGRIFPGVHHFSRFGIDDASVKISIRVAAGDLTVPLLEIECEEADVFPESSLFSSLAESSRFFEAGAIGYSSRPRPGILDGLLLKVDQWKVAPLKVDRVRSVYFDNPSLFPPDSIRFDHALLMRDIPHEWHSEPAMHAPAEGGFSL